MMNGYSHQRGSVLFVSLVMLVMLTLVVVNAINISGVNLKIVGNMQHRAATEAAAQRAVEQVLGSAGNFYSPTAAVSVAAPSGMTVSVSNRTCLAYGPAPGYSAISGMSPEDTQWDLRVTVTDGVTGSSTTMSQGVRIRMLAGSCV